MEECAAMSTHSILEGTPEETEIDVANSVLQSGNSLESNLSALALGITSHEGVLIQVRNLVEWSGYRRRRGRSEQLIQTALDKLGLRTNPDFRDSHISGFVFLQRIEAVPSADSAKFAPVQPVSAVDRDAHILKVGRLEAANRKPVSLAPGASIYDATSLMIKFNYSQLPIMASERRSLGIVSWESISTWTLRHGKLPTRVDECLSPIEEVSFDATLFDTIGTILDQDCVLVRKNDNVISGIITAADLGIQFSEMSEAFLKIGQIEAILRIIIEKYYPPEEIKNAKDPSDNGRTVTSVDDLTFGEYKRLLESEEKWNTYFKLKISRRVFIETLEEVRIIRNDVMHFDPAGIEDVDIDTLSVALQFLNSIKEML